MRREISTARPVSSAASRTAASCTVSPTSTKPPGSAHCPSKGSLPRRIKTTPASEGITTSTISFGVSGPAKVPTSFSCVSVASKGYAPSHGARGVHYVGSCHQGQRIASRIQAAWPTRWRPRCRSRRRPGIACERGYALRSDRKIHVKILCISDRVESMLYGPNLTSYARGVEAVISCGDLPFDYLEYIVTFLGVPVYYVLGNHDPDPESREYPGGCTPLDGRVVEGGGVVLAGLSGSPVYSGGPNQYTQRHMRRRAWALSVRIRCRGLVGRPKPRIFATHSPPFGLGDQEDVAHVGFESFVDLIDRHEPPLWLHGHVHLYGPDQERVRQKGDTKIVNVYGHRILDV